jgi:hypothetical protein
LTENTVSHRYCTRAVEDVCGHDGAVFGERVWKRRREAEMPEVVTICDHLAFLLLRKPEHEVSGKPPGIPTHGLVQRLRRHAVKACEIGIDHHPLTTHEENDRLDAWRGDRG